jgi:hypothetical protein
LDKRDYEYLEIPIIKFIELCKKHNILIDENEYLKKEDEPIIPNSEIGNVNLDDKIKREKFIKYAKSFKEKEFWKLFFEEIDTRSFVKATFKVDEFGVYIHNKNHFNSSGGKYSLMYTRSGIFKMNDASFQGNSWNGLNRLKNWCTTPELPDEFYSSLKSKNLLTGMQVIDIPRKANSMLPKQIIEDLFYCIDLFR